MPPHHVAVSHVPIKRPAVPRAILPLVWSMATLRHVQATQALRLKFHDHQDFIYGDSEREMKAT